MPYKDRAKKNAVIKRYRDARRTQAIAALGNACVECAFTGNPLAFDIVNVEPGATGRSKREGLGPRQHRRIIEGDHSGVLLLCGCCSNVRARSNASIHVNLRAPVPRQAARPPATLGTRALARKRR